MHPQRQGGATLKALAFVRSARYRDRVERRANGKTGQKNFNPSSFRGNIPLPVKHLRSFSIVKIEHWKEKRAREFGNARKRPSESAPAISRFSFHYCDLLSIEFIIPLMPLSIYRLSC